MSGILIYEVSAFFWKVQAEFDLWGQRGEGGGIILEYSSRV
jgi:hypothetical protein